MPFPSSFMTQMQDLLGSEYNAFFMALQDTSPASIRINPTKWNRDIEKTYQELLGDVVPWSSYGFYLKSRPVYTLDPLLHAGVYYVQEASSMFIEQVIKQALAVMGKTDGPVTMLDLCAAPGGKSTLALSVLPENSFLVANELIKNRAMILAENCTKWGYPNVAVTQADAVALGRQVHSFDLVLADVPCSGEGMFRKEVEAMAAWSEQTVSLCAARQREIVRAIWPAIRPGGCLIYSTCTFNSQENEENVRWFCEQLGAETISIPLQSDWHVAPAYEGYEDIQAYHFFPHRVKGEGFFTALLQKKTSVKEKLANGMTLSSGKIRPAKVSHSIKLPESIKQGIKHSEQYRWSINEKGAVTLIPSSYADGVEALSHHLRVIQSGVKVGMLKGSDWIPDSSLALSNIIDIQHIKQYTLSLEEARRFLRKETWQVSSNWSKGWYLVTYKQVPLGWIKQVGDRFNNAWPAEWRIRMRLDSAVEEA
jgi:16S rRNA C967 or C1407 C5-methylase (RsmB/RsmF family)/NOL1/NOP2/fmu family ribosome biogenesis protein